MSTPETPTTPSRTGFSPIFRSGGDSLWRATDDDGRLLYACSDGTKPSECEDGPYIIDIDKVRAEGLILRPSLAGNGRLYGQFRYRRRNGEWGRVSSSLGCSRELIHRLGVTKVTLEFEEEVRNGGPWTPYVTESFKLVGRFESAPVGDRVES